MAQNNGFDISRREILAGLGTIGVASAGAGLGTTAYFSDREDFANNQLTAGELDLKVDWQEHYSDWSDDEAEDITTISMEPEDGLTGFPSAAPPSEQSVFVSDPDLFLRNTAIEAFPDPNPDDYSDLDNVTEDDVPETDYDALKSDPSNDSDICDLPADTDGGEGILSHPFRTRGTFPPDTDSGFGDLGNQQTTEPGDPLINIADVKPGDFGEVTFSFHLCGNPGYVWLTGELVDASENGLTEPERKDPDEEEGVVELLDEIRAAFWYDTGTDGVYGADFEDKDDGEGDNLHQPSENFVPLTGSLRDVLQMLEAGRVPLDFSPTPTDGNNGSGGTGGTTGFPVCDSANDAEKILLSTDLNGVNSPGNISCPTLATLLTGQDIVEGGTTYVGAKLEADDNGNIPLGNYSSGYGGIITVESIDSDAGTITVSTDFPVEVVGIKGGNQGEREYIFETQGGTEDDGTDEQYGCVLNSVTFQTPDNIEGQGNSTGPAQISNIDFCFDPMTPEDPGVPPQGEPGRQCFPNSTTAYIGFEWWLPVDHANEIQTDSVAFDLGFYTEQCRHNDGSGLAPENG